MQICMLNLKVFSPYFLCVYICHLGWSGRADWDCCTPPPGALLLRLHYFNILIIIDICICCNTMLNTTNNTTHHQCHHKHHPDDNQQDHDQQDHNHQDHDQQDHDHQDDDQQVNDRHQERLTCKPLQGLCLLLCTQLAQDWKIFFLIIRLDSFLKSIWTTSTEKGINASTILDFRFQNVPKRPLFEDWGDWGTGGLMLVRVHDM